MTEVALGIGSRIEHPKFGLGIVVDLDSGYYKIYFSNDEDIKSIDRSFDGIVIVDKVEPDPAPIDMEVIEKAVSKVFLKYVDPPQFVPLGGKWIGGSLIITPGSEDLTPKEIPIETFFHKIVMVRDRLRVLEQSINSHKKLDDEDKVHLQQYITRMYGSLTTFNVLFNHKDYHFKGEGKK